MHKLNQLTTVNTNLFVPVVKETVPIVERIHKEAYPPEMRVWTKELLENDAIIERQIGHFSFLLYNGTYAGHCLALVDDSFIEPESGQRALFVADMVVKPELQGMGYGRLLAQEVLRRASEANIDRIEFCAREATSYLAINQSSHTEKILSSAGFNKFEIGRQKFNESLPDSEYGRLIVLQKQASK